MRASGIPDAIEKLRYLRRAHKRHQVRRISVRGITAILVAGAAFLACTTGARPRGRQTLVKAFTISVPAAPEPLASPKAWAVEQHGAFAVYSNGLIIRNDYVTESEGRSFHVFAPGTLARSGPFTRPAGIVFHTTESLLLPLEEGHNRALVRTREDLLRHVRDGRLYNFLIDRFGQVFRIVPEDQVAHHAGHSVWADANSIYEGLNESFLGVSFESRTERPFEATPAQIRSGKLLTDVLRADYDIPESNCVTHAQVSVNPDNMRFGYHTDWAAHFPFRDFGLSSGYRGSIAAIRYFGFDYDQLFLNAIGGKPWEGLLLAEQGLSAQAKLHHLDEPAFRAQLQREYQRIRSHPHEAIAISNRT